MPDTLLVIFLNGAGLNASIWNSTLPLLKHTTLAVEYPNRGLSGSPNKKLTLDDYHSEILQQLSRKKEQNILIVAHSIGGIFCNKIAAELKGKVVGIVAIGAIIAEKGETFLSTFPWVQRTITRFIVKRIRTRPPDSQIIKGLCHDLPDESAKKIVSEFTAESAIIYTDKITEPVPDCTGLYIILNGDKSIPVDVQKRSAKRLKQAKTVNMDTGHLPMISQPERLAEIINNFAGGSISKEISSQK